MHTEHSKAKKKSHLKKYTYGVQHTRILLCLKLYLLIRIPMHEIDSR